MPAARQRLARFLAEERAVVVGKVSQVPEPPFERQLLDGARGGGGFPQGTPHSVKPLMTEKGGRPQAQRVAE